MKLPGLIDPHVHLREPGAIYKEDWDSGTSAALAGGFTTVLAMPNTQPPIIDEKSLALALKSAKGKARCDYAQYIGAGHDNAIQIINLASRVAGLKMYLDQTYGPLRLDKMTLWMEHLANWPSDVPIVAHAEGRTLAAVILLAAFYNRSIHLAHISTREEILIIRAAKERGFLVTCEVTPHHLFLTQNDASTIGPSRSEVRPRLATKADQDALWENLDVIDCFATDHAPHTLEEKDSDNPPPGFPGLETALPLFSTAIHERKLSWDDLILRMDENPRRIFHLPKQSQTWIEFDPLDKWELRARETYTRCGWTPFEGRRVQGRLRKVILRGKTAFEDGSIIAQPGFGRNVRL
jgi:carbamoyl-phosphate synthase/aspartate carbamoyltransferase/dihydroorotase